VTASLAALLVATKFIVVSDIHVSPKAVVAPAFKAVVERIVERKPRFVVIVGDSTNGNKDDHHTAATVAKWWKALRGALEPLRAAGIPVLPVAGNHDSYRDVHRRGYFDAWSDLADVARPLEVRGRAATSPEIDALPFSYSVDVDGLHLSLAHIVDQGAPAAVKKWLEADLRGASSSQARLVFGHVPLMSVMGRTSDSFKKKFGSFLIENRVAAYVAGHEHLAWDEDVAVSASARVRQVTVGTSSGTYNFGLSKASRAKAKCAAGRCTMPHGGYRFAIQGDGKQKHKATFAEISVEGGAVAATHHALGASGALVPFAE